MNKMIEVKNLKKSYKTGKAVDGVSFDVYKGEILCILGPNGAGKSTTINMLTGALGWDGGGIYADFLKGKASMMTYPLINGGWVSYRRIWQSTRI